MATIHCIYEPPYGRLTSEDRLGNAICCTANDSQAAQRANRNTAKETTEERHACACD